MTTIPIEHSTWDALRRELQREVLGSLPEHLRRLAWGREQIERAQLDGLRALLAHATTHSPFHARRLAGIDPAAITLEDLPRLPVMTKADMMGALDDVFTDRRLDRAAVERALAATRAEPVPILDAYTALATGGSSGERGIFVFDVPARAGFVLSILRSVLGRLEAGGGPPPGGLPAAMVAAASAVHATGAAAAETAGGAFPLRILPVPVTLPLPQIVERLNALRAPGLFGYPSMLTRLADEQRAGRLRIAPRMVTSTSETLTSAARAAIGAAFGAPIVDGYATTEGLVGASAPGDDVLVFTSDLCIVELVDADNRPVPPGIASDKVLLTNLYNFAQPLIRYELADRFVRRPDAPDHGHLCATVEGRSDELLRFRGVEIHGHVVRSVVVADAGIADYRIRQTPEGVDVDVIAPAGVEGDLTGRVASALAAAGLERPRVRVRAVEELERDPLTGKLQRLVPLAGGPSRGSGPHP